MDKDKMKEQYLDFDEYIQQREPDELERHDAWRVAIGLQAVDGLETSEYLKETAQRNIIGDITIDEAHDLIKQYYVTKKTHNAGDDDKEEADRVSSNIVKVLTSRTFDFSTGGYQSVHRRIFEGVMKHAGELRTYDITKKEWVLEGDTVLYLNWEDLHRALDYDIEQERAFSYKDKSVSEMISHISSFVSGLWQIHAFCEGNTRATAVFTIQYLRSLGFNVNNDMFERHSWYFRNALVRANYRNVAKGVEYAPVYLERFFSNLLIGDGWDLRNRYLHIHPSEEWSVQPNLICKSCDEKDFQPNVGAKGKNDPKDDPKELSERQTLMLNLIKTNDLITIRQMAQKVNVSEKTIKRELAILQGKGFLTREGGRKEGKWICRCPHSQLLGRHS